MSTTVPQALVEQLDWHWQGQLRPRLEGLTDAEYRWEPVPGWSIRRREESAMREPFGTGEFTCDYEWPEPSPAPFTTIAWRLAHLVVGVLGTRAAAHFGGPACEYATFAYAGTADEALAQLDEKYALWMDGVRRWDMDDLMVPVGDAEPPQWSHMPRLDLVLHINREMIHHGAEVCLLRDLWQHQVGR